MRRFLFIISTYILKALKSANFLILSLAIAVGFSIPGFSQDPTTIEQQDNYKEWGWNVRVMQNSLVTLATVPAIGARVMQYDLGDHSSIYVNIAELGKTYTPSSGNFWPNFGGFKNWPAPQAVWNWPPPPTIDYSAYAADIIANTADSVSLRVIGPTEQWTTPDLRFERIATLYRGSTRIKMDQTLINEGSEVASWGVWDITQSPASHSGQKDFENFRVYFPISDNSVFGEEGVTYWDNDSGWLGEVAPGIFGVQYRAANNKIFADAPEGWICHVDERDSVAYAKTFEIYNGAEYPDGGANLAVYMSSGFLNYFEVEVMSPVVNLNPDGGSYTFTENWWMAKIHGPIISVTNAGAVASFEYISDEERFTGKFGVFHIAGARMEFLDDAGILIDSSAVIPVTPMEMFTLDESKSIPEQTSSVRVVLLNESGETIGVLISRSVSDLLTSVPDDKGQSPKNCRLHQNFPNPFNPETRISFSQIQSGLSKLTVYNTLGEEIVTLLHRAQTAGRYEVVFNGSDLPGGVYIYRLRVGETVEMKKMLLIN